MKKLTLLTITLAISYITFAQSPQSFQYQAVVRDINGVALQNQSVGFQLSIISGSPTGTTEYVETHTASTNNFGIVTLIVGGGTTTDNFAGINWGSASHFLKVEANLGSGYLDMGTTQLLSVPYALYSENAGNVTTYTAGSGISITGNVIDNTSPDQIVNITGNGATSVTGTYPNFTVTSTDNNTTYTAGTGINVTGTTITNTLPDQTVVINSGTGTNVTGTYPNFTINNSQPDQTVAITGSGATSVTGTYPNFTVTSTDNNTTYTAGTGINITGTTITNTLPDQTVVVNSGTGTNVTGTYPNFTINNSQPDQTVAITGSGATSVTGTYPNFTVSSTDNNTTYSAGTGLNLTGTTFSSTQTLAQTLANGNSAGTFNILMNNRSITGANILGLGSSNANYIDMYWGHIYDYNGSHGINGQVLTVHGTSPNTYVTWDTPVSYTFGNGLSLTGNTVNSVWSTNGNHIYNNNTGNVGVGINNPFGKMVVQGDVATSDTVPLFEVKDKLGHTVFVVYPDSVHIYVKDTGVKSNKGGFAVSGKNTSKALTHDFLYVDPDYTRVFTGDTIAGFGVENIGATGDNSYMHLTPNNYLIGHQAGDSLTSGMYNSFFGYKCGISNTSGSYNVFSGYQSGYSNKVSNFNTFIGYKSGLANTGSDNTFIGYEAGKSHLLGGGNVYLGSKAGQLDLNGVQNIFIGENSGLNNNNGSQNIFIGYSSGKSNINGNYNVFIGKNAGFQNTNGNGNVVIGDSCGYKITGYYNTLLGYMAGVNHTGNNATFLGTGAGQLNTSGDLNTFIGNSAGTYNTTGSSNTYVGTVAGIGNSTGNNNTMVGTYCGFGVFNNNNNNNSFFGSNSGYSVSTGSNNCFFGTNSGHNNVTGAGNVFIGYNSGYNETSSNKLYIENSNSSSPLIYGEFDNKVLKLYSNSTWIKHTTNSLTNGLFIDNISNVNYWSLYQYSTSELHLLYNGADRGSWNTVSGAYTAISDIKLKKNIEPLNNMLSLINLIEPKMYNFKTQKDGEQKYLGFIAQDIKDLFPSLVSYANESDTYMVDYAGFSVVAIQAIKEQQKLIESLIKRIENLENKTK